jgi:3-hydroxy-3-methylglutaryl CoA synthase
LPAVRNDEASAGNQRWGAHIPPTRLPLALIGGRPPIEGGPEKAVAAFDEDSITMAVAAATDCLGDTDRASIDALLFATTSAPYAEKLGAALIAKALDLPRRLRTSDYGGSLRAGTNALLAACDAVAAGTLERVLVVIADARLAAPRSAMEANLGDAAVAFLIGKQEVAARLDASSSVADEILDVWRAADDRFVRSWEERFVTTHGYGEVVADAVNAFLSDRKETAADYRRIALYGPDARSLAATGRTLGFDADRLADP